MNLLFDLDGTLTDPAEGITRCLADALERLGRPAPALAALRCFIGPPLRSSFEELLRSREASLVDEAIRLYRERFGTVGLLENRVHDGIPELLEELVGAGHELRVVTAKPTVYAKRIVQHFGLAPFLRQVHGSELSGERGDKAELLAHVLSTQGLLADDCLMIGDRRHDLRGARAHGMRAIAVTWGYGSLEELTAEGAEVLVGNLSELREAIERRAAGSASAGD